MRCSVDVLILHASDHYKSPNVPAFFASVQLVQVPTKHGKADLTIYRNAGSRVLEILSRVDVRVERASIDECYVDLTNEATRRLADLGGEPAMPSRPEQVHVYGADRAANT